MRSGGKRGGAGDRVLESGRVIGWPREWLPGRTIIRSLCCRSHAERANSCCEQAFRPPMRLRPEKRRFRKMAYSMRSLLNRQLKPRRVSLFDDPGHERNPGLAEPHAGEQRCLHYRRGNTRAQARRVTNRRSPSLRLPSERVPWCTWAESAVSRHFHANSRVSPSDP